MSLFETVWSTKRLQGVSAMIKRIFLEGVSETIATTVPVRAASYASEPKPDRKHVSLLFGDIVGSTELLAEMGDLKWMDVVSAYYAIVRREHKFFGGHYLTTIGDGFLAGFDHAMNAVDCASAILRSVKGLGLKMRIGVHAGECFDMGEQLVGLTVHVGARIAATAAEDEVLVSDSVKNQIADSDLRFVDRGMHNLKGVPGEWRLFGAR
jgi:class 3 adenylate cyclase